jgi:hypothetical protein
MLTRGTAPWARPRRDGRYEIPFSPRSLTGSACQAPTSGCHPARTGSGLLACTGAGLGHSVIGGSEPAASVSLGTRRRAGVRGRLVPGTRHRRRHPSITAGPRLLFGLELANGTLALRVISIISAAAFARVVLIGMKEKDSE